MRPSDSPTRGVLPPIAITGPTASGKTAAALLLAQHLPIEIISMDSALVYRRMDIGSAKPSRAERQCVPHHLIDIREPFESYNVAAFLKDATALVRDISQRGKWPVFVGGTMLYLQCLIKGLDDMPPVDPRIRNEVNERAAHMGWPAMHQELRALDPATADRLAPQDAQRIGRALEVVLSSGQTLSSLQKGRAQGLPGLLDERRLISLEPLDRQVLHQRIESRLTTMMESGFLEEAHGLYQDPSLSIEMPAMRSVGYRQAFEVLAHYQQQASPINPMNTSDQQRFMARWYEPAAAATRQLAKRQLTWLRAMQRRQVVAMHLPDAAQKVRDLALGCADSYLPHS